MVTTLIVSIITFVAIIASILFFPHLKIGKIKLDTYWIIALIGAIILLSTSLSPINEVYNQLTSSSSINPLKILILFFSMTLISVFLDEFGLFRFLAVYASNKAKGNQYVLFIILYFLTALLTIFTSNDVVILTLTPFICFFCKNSKINPLPYLIGEFVAANTWSTMFIIGNPTNIYLATSAGINFLSYFKVMALPTIIGGLLELGIIILIFNKKLKEPISSSELTYKIESKVDLIAGLVTLGICLIFLVISSYINIEMWIISISSACALLLFTLIYRLITKKHWNYLGSSLKRLPYQLIPFFLSMFVIVVAINVQGISSKIALVLNNDNALWAYGYSSLFMSNVINNIPMSILYSSLPNNLSSVYATIIGSNIGAFLTPIGALAGIMFTSLTHKYDVKLSFLDFAKYGVVIAIPTITIELATLLLVI